MPTLLENWELHEIGIMGYKTSIIIILCVSGNSIFVAYYNCCISEK
jgi:hypothetical protein